MMLKLAASAALTAATIIATPLAAAVHADTPLDIATREVCGMGGRSGHPWQIYGEKLSLEQRFGLTDAQATSLMWQAINTGCP